MKPKARKTYTCVCLTDDEEEISFDLLAWDEGSVYEELNQMELNIISVSVDEKK